MHPLAVLNPLDLLKQAKNVIFLGFFKKSENILPEFTKIYKKFRYHKHFSLGQFHASH